MSFNDTKIQIEKGLWGIHNESFKTRFEREYFGPDDDDILPPLEKIPIRQFVMGNPPTIDNIDGKIYDRIVTIPLQPTFNETSETIPLSKYNETRIKSTEKKEFSIFDEDDEDYTFLPIKRPALIEHYYAQRNVHWVPADIDQRHDRVDFDTKCTENMRTFIKGLLGFFAPADGLVNENIFRNFQVDTSFWKEARFFYAEQASMETIHGEMYSLMAQSLIRNEDELNDIFNSIRTMPSVAKIATFMKKYMDRSYSLLERILAFACVEGILFNSAFAAIYWIKKKNILLGFCKANEFIARDEAIHFKFAITLYLMLDMKNPLIAPSPTRIYDIVREAVETNEAFIDEIIKGEMIGMNSDDLKAYTKCIADSVLVAIGQQPKLYNVENPFDWMAIIQLPNKSNFFEGKTSEYTQGLEGDFVYDEDAYF